jgi:hypothetical protein
LVDHAVNYRRALRVHETLGESLQPTTMHLLCSLLGRLLDLLLERRFAEPSDVDGATSVARLVG